MSLAPGEELDKNNMAEICEACAKDFGFENNQYLAVSHKDTNHQHFHIIANRIGFDTKTVRDSNNYKTIANFCRKMEIRYGLQQVPNPRRFLSKVLQQIPRLDNRKEHLKARIESALNQSRDYKQFEQKMKANGYQLIKGRGISFIDNKKVKVKGSEVNFSLHNIEKFLGNHDRILFKIEKIDQLTDENISNTQSEILSKNQTGLSISESVIKDISQGLQHLIKPEQNLDIQQPQMIKKKRKKQHHHL